MSKQIKTDQKEEKSEFSIPEYPFIDYLKDLKKKENSGAMAALRRGLQHEPGTYVDMYPYVVPWLQKVRGKWKKEVYYLIASLFAYHPKSTNDGDMGDVFRKIFLNRGENESLEQRFVTLLRCDPEDLPFHMRQAISLAKSEDIPINWNELFFDLLRWPYESDYPPYEKWAESFWKRKSIKSED